MSVICLDWVAATKIDEFPDIFKFGQHFVVRVLFIGKQITDFIYDNVG